MAEVSQAQWMLFLERAQKLEGWQGIVGRYRAAIITRAISENWGADQIQAGAADAKSVAGVVRWMENQLAEGRKDGRKSRYTGKAAAAIAAAAAEGLESESE